MNLQKTKNPREAAYLALLLAAKDECFISEALHIWNDAQEPSHLDLQLARQIAYGACQRALTLDYLALQMAENKKLKLKPKERLLLHTALYQAYFLERIPLYAIINESVNLAKKYGFTYFAKFLNALLHKIPEHPFRLPESDSAQALSIRYSYPLYFVQLLLKEYDLETAKTILACGNAAAPAMALLLDRSNPLPEGMKKIGDHIALVESGELIPTLAASEKYYIQNGTPISLIEALAARVETEPTQILDLCASPGGKLLNISRYFPRAELYANDISEEKLIRIKENCKKYHLSATLSVSPGEHFKTEKKFDIVIVDAPCSNSGVLNKRAEARWRLSEQNLKELQKLQEQLLANAISLTSERGEVWYMTCSILREENERVAEKIAHAYGWKIKWYKIILPNAQGWDGGFACSLTR